MDALTSILAESSVDREELKRLIVEAVKEGAQESRGSLSSMMIEAVKQGAKEWMTENFERSASGAIRWIFHTAAVALFGGLVVAWASAGFPLPFSGGSGSRH